MTTRLYGIPNCDTVRKARQWCDAQGIAVTFVDLRETPPAAAVLERWHAAVGEALLNRRSTTWKQLDASAQAEAAGAGLIPLLQRHPTLIKRPVLEHNDTIAVGFKAADWADYFAV
jgi:Spx/MgsR family transcriptional regulator